MSLQNLFQKCSKGKKAYELYNRFIERDVNFGKLDDKFLKHLEECKNCKKILKEVIKIQKDLLKEKPEERERVLDRLDIFVGIFCTFDEKCNEFWDEERFGSVEEYKQNCAKPPPTLEKLLQKFHEREADKRYS